MSYNKLFGDNIKLFWASAVFGSALVIFWFAFSWVRADYLYVRGQKLAEQGSLLRGAVVLEKALALWPLEPAYHRELAAVYARLAGIYSADERRELLESADQEAQKAYELNPSNLITLKSLVTTYYTMSLLDSSYQEDTLRLSAEAINKCPTDPTLWYLTGVVYTGFGQRHEARKNLERALELRANYPKARQALEVLD